MKENFLSYGQFLAAAKRIRVGLNGKGDCFELALKGLEEAEGFSPTEPIGYSKIGIEKALPNQKEAERIAQGILRFGHFCPNVMYGATLALRGLIDGENIYLENLNLAALQAGFNETVF